MAGTLVVDTINTESNANLTLNPGSGNIVVEGNLNVETNQIATTASNRDIELAPHGTGSVELRGNTNPGTVKFNCENNSHAVTVRGPAHSAAASYTLTLPTSDGNANDCLVSDGSGVLSWSARATTSGASLSADNTWTGAQRATLTNVDSSSGTLALDLNASNSFLCITTENITTINWTNLADAAVGQTGSIFFQYGGAHSVGGWAAASRWAGGTGGDNNAPSMTATSGKADRVDYVVVRDADSSGNQRVQLVATLNYED